VWIVTPLSTTTLGFPTMMKTFSWMDDVVRQKWALNAITGADPAPAGSTFQEAAEAWLKWGMERGYL